MAADNSIGCESQRESAIKSDQAVRLVQYSTDPRKMHQEQK